MIVSVHWEKKGIRRKLDTALHGLQWQPETFAVTDFSEACFLEFVFDAPITAFQNHAYRWEVLPSKHPVFCGLMVPKVIRLAHGQLIQATIQGGHWELHARYPNRLRWWFYPEKAQVLTRYTGAHQERQLESVAGVGPLPALPGLLFCTQYVSWSRAPIPFAATACFTDHCDFDTPENLETQRQFLQECGIRVTKGMFVHHFSKREDNASWEREAALLQAWANDGHELAYHSLTQSIRDQEAAFQEFETTIPPVSMPTWIDHGYQPYNLSLYAHQGKSDAWMGQQLSHKNITNLWNYVDCGTATKGVLNQLNPQHFTLKAYHKGNRTLGGVTRLSLLLKAILFHYYAQESLIRQYKSLASQFKAVVFRRQWRQFPEFVKKMIHVTGPLSKVLFRWGSRGSESFPLARYQTLFFEYTIATHPVSIFQTVEMVDFERALCPTNIDDLIADSGVFIAHTYFSVPLAYHTGRLLLNDQTVQPKVRSNFEYLGEKIRGQVVWNPTLDEWMAYVKGFTKTVLTCDASGHSVVVCDGQLNYRITTS